MARRKGFVATLVKIQREAERERERKERAAARWERDQARARATEARSLLQNQRERERSHAEARTREAAEDTLLLEQEVGALESVLAATLAVDDHLDLEALKQPPTPPVFDPSKVGRPPVAPDEAAFALERPSALGRVFGASKHAAKVEQRQVDYAAALAAHEQAAERHAERVEEARRRHEAGVASLLEDHRRHVEEVNELQRGLTARKPEAVVRYLDLVLEAAEYPEGFPHSWRLAYTSSTRHLSVEYELPPLAVIPTAKAYKYVKSSDSITATARSVAQVKSLYAEVLRQTALRVLHELLEADRDALVRSVALNGFVEDTHPATGRPVRACLLAVATSRERFLELDLSRVDTAACLAHLEARVSKDPSKLQAVEPIEVSGSLEADYTLEADDEEDVLGSGQPDLVGDADTVAVRELAAGQNVPLAGDRVQVELLARDADLSVLLLGADGRVQRDEDFIFYNNPVGVGGAVRLSIDALPRVDVDLDALGQVSERLVLVISAADGLRSVSDAAAVVRSPHGETLAFRPSGNASVTAMAWGELYLRGGGWRVRAVGQGWADGLAGLARDYGVDVE